MTGRSGRILMTWYKPALYLLNPHTTKEVAEKFDIKPNVVNNMVSAFRLHGIPVLKNGKKYAVFQFVATKKDILSLMGVESESELKAKKIKIIKSAPYYRNRPKLKPGNIPWYIISEQCVSIYKTSKTT